MAGDSVGGVSELVSVRSRAQVNRAERDAAMPGSYDPSVRARLPTLRSGSSFIHARCLLAARDG
jgi:hypothetical protein